MAYIRAGYWQGKRYLMYTTSGGPEPTYYNTFANRNKYHYACITGLPRPGYDRQINITSEDDILHLQQCNSENPVTLKDFRGSEVQFLGCRIGKMKDDGTRLIGKAQYRVEKRLGRTGKINGKKFTVIQLPQVAQRKIRRADYADDFPNAQSQELVEFEDTQEQVYLDVLNAEGVQLDPPNMMECTYTHDPDKRPEACIVYGGITYSVFDVFVNKDSMRRGGVTIDDLDDEYTELSRDVALLRVQKGTPTEKEVETIKTVYQLPGNSVLDSTSLTGDILRLSFKIPEKQAAKRARINANARFIDQTLSLLKL